MLKPFVLKMVADPAHFSQMLISLSFWSQPELNVETVVNILENLFARVHNRNIRPQLHQQLIHRYI